MLLDSFDFILFFAINIHCWRFVGQVHWSSSGVEDWYEKHHEVLIAPGTCWLTVPVGKPSCQCAPVSWTVQCSGLEASLGPVVWCFSWQVGLSHQLHKLCGGSGHRHSVSARPRHVAVLAPLLRAIQSSPLPQPMLLQPTTYHLANQQAYTVANHTK